MRWVLGLFISWSLALTAAEPRNGYAEIQVLDAATKLGVPLVELTTVNDITFVTDNAGRVAVREPDLLNHEVYFSVRGHGYEVPKDGFGFSGVRLTLKAGEVTTVRLKRTLPAERLTRLTGTGRWRDTELLGQPVPVQGHKTLGNVAGQDSVQVANYQGKLYWFWGDTNYLKYPLGLFRTAGATSASTTAEPLHGFAYDYFVNQQGFAKAMLPLPERPEGAIWMFGICVVRDGMTEKLVGHYSRRAGLTKELEHGIAVFDDDKQVFTIAKQLPETERWRFPKGSPTTIRDGGQDWLYFGNPYPTVRVPANYNAILEPKSYEAYTLIDGQWTWQRDREPTDTLEEIKLVNNGKRPIADARFAPVSAGKQKPIHLHTGTVRWNAARQKYIIIGCRMGGETSHLGEVWYTESQTLTGPYTTAIPIAQHDKQTFYNVVQHSFLDRDDGKQVYFEGTYTNEFSGNPWKTPRYNYNQILYRVQPDSPAFDVFSK